MSEIKPTPGPWSVFEHSWCETSISAPGTSNSICLLDINHATEESQEADEAQMAANARLIAEAGTVHHETGLTPRQLAERVQELEDTLDHMAKSMTRQLDLIAERAPGAFLDKQPVINTLRMHSQRAQKALSNALPNAAAKEAGK